MSGMKTIQLSVLSAALLSACAFTAEAAPLKVLAIGNSFTQSLMPQLPQCAKAIPGVELDFATIVIGGCSLERHWSNVEKSSDAEFRPYTVMWNFASVADRKNQPFGDAMVNGKANIPQMLKAVKWDIVTIQQVSRMSFKPETFEDYTGNLVATIKKFAPQAEIRFQQTWAYCDAHPGVCADATPGKPGSYGLNQQQMFEKVVATYDSFAAKYNLKVIPSGEAIQAYRKALPVTFKPPTKAETAAMKKGDLPDMGGDPVGSYRWGKGPKWNRKAKDNEEYKLRCDSIHLNEEGKYLQACTWIATLFKNDLSKLTFKPKCLSEERAALMRKCAAKAAKARY